MMKWIWSMVMVCALCACHSQSENAGTPYVKDNTVLQRALCLWTRTAKVTNPEYKYKKLGRKPTQKEQNT